MRPHEAYDEAAPPALVAPVSPSPMRATEYDMPRAVGAVAQRDNLVTRLILGRSIVETDWGFMALSEDLQPNDVVMGG